VCGVDRTAVQPCGKEIQIVTWRAVTLQVCFVWGAKEGTIATATVCYFNVAGCYALPLVIHRTERAGEELNFGKRQDI
jgi:hypothetical protein